MSRSFPLRKMSQNQKAAVAEFNSRLATGSIEMKSLPCACCDAHQPKVLFTNDRYGIDQPTVICQECGFVYLDPRMSAEELEQFYNQDFYRLLYVPDVQVAEDLRKQAENSWRNAEQADPGKPLIPTRYDKFGFLSFLRDSGVDFDSVCEVGAAAGANLLPLAAMGKKVSGVEPSPAMSGFARERGLNVAQGSLGQVEGRHDLIMMLHVFEHVFEPVEFLRQIAKLAPTYLLLEVPGMMHKVPSLQNAHNFYFSQNTLKAVAARAGWECIGEAVYLDCDFLLALFRYNPDLQYFPYDRQTEFRNAFAMVNTYKRRLGIRTALRRLGLKGLSRRVALNPVLRRALRQNT